MLAIILLIIKFATGFLQNMAVLIGIAAGYRRDDRARLDGFFGASRTSRWLRFVLPLRFGLPQFYLVPCLTMCLVMTIVFIEATGMFLALGAMTGKPIGRRRHQAGPARRRDRHDHRRDLQHVPLCLLFAEHRPRRRHRRLQPLGLRRRRRHHAGARASFPKLAFIVASVPPCVLGGAGFIMFGMVAATGIKILVDRRLSTSERNNVLVVAISIGFGLIPIVAPNFFQSFPAG